MTCNKNSYIIPCIKETDNIHIHIRHSVLQWENIASMHCGTDIPAAVSSILVQDMEPTPKILVDLPDLEQKD